MTDEAGHIPVLLDEVLELLDPQPGETVVDCTVGRGGHALAFAERIGRSGVIIGFDLDPDNLVATEQRLDTLSASHSSGVDRDDHRSGPDVADGEQSGPPMPGRCDFIPIHANYASIAHHLVRLDRRAEIVLADLGFSSSQMDDPERGFSFSRDGPLDMRLNPKQETTAADLVNSLSESELADVIYQYGEEPLARKIARIVVQKRHDEPIRTTAQLAGLVREAYGRRAYRSRMHPATRTFMALRVAVNDELGSLRSLLEDITREAERMYAQRGSWLAGNARIGIICFHSLEDRLVKRCFTDLDKRGLARRVTKRPVMCSEQEAKSNPRARSAKLRVLRFEDRARA